MFVNHSQYKQFQEYKLVRVPLSPLKLSGTVMCDWTVELIVFVSRSIEGHCCCHFCILENLYVI